MKADNGGMHISLVWWKHARRPPTRTRHTVL